MANPTGVPENPDIWVDRSTKMLCGTCMFFNQKKTHRVQTADHYIGRCKRHAPTMMGFPVVWSDDGGCGDHKLDETKI
jgi:hypothetical protein